MIRLVLYLFFSCVFQIIGYCFVLTGGLFGDDEDPTIEAAFKYAIHRINQDRTILPKTKIGFDIQHLPASNSFLAAKKGKSNFVKMSNLSVILNKIIILKRFLIFKN